jgi:hypothetical protein
MRIGFFMMWCGKGFGIQRCQAGPHFSGGGPESNQKHGLTRRDRESVTRMGMHGESDAIRDFAFAFHWQASLKLTVPGCAHNLACLKHETILPGFHLARPEHG